MKKKSALEHQIIKNKYLELHTISLGASMTNLYFTDRNGRRTNVIYGFGDTDRYKGNPFYMGATCGRYAGRIANHSFSIGDKNYKLESEGDVHLHGGKQALAFREWELKDIVHGATPSVTYSFKSPHLDGGYPGNLEIEATYTLDQNALRIAYSATSDRNTHINLTNHNYYNLNGGGSVRSHELLLNADEILETDSLNVPTGKILKIKDTPFDHTRDKKLEDTLKEVSLDHVFIWNKETPKARLYAPSSGIEMTMHTDQPSVVIFVPESFDKGPFRNDAPESYPAICLEAQNYPNAPNEPNFPSSLLEKGEVYQNNITLEFNLRE